MIRQDLMSNQPFRELERLNIEYLVFLWQPQYWLCMLIMNVIHAKYYICSEIVTCLMGWQ